MRESGRKLEDLGELEELRARADAGNTFAAARLADWLAERGDLEELRTQADAGNEGSHVRLADLLIS